MVDIEALLRVVSVICWLFGFGSLAVLALFGIVEFLTNHWKDRGE